MCLTSQGDVVVSSCSKATRGITDMLTLHSLLFFFIKQTHGVRLAPKHIVHDGN